jgi:hypothetical protein
MNIKDEIQHFVWNTTFDSVRDSVLLLASYSVHGSVLDSLYKSVKAPVYISVYNSVNGNVENEMVEYEYSK